MSLDGSDLDVELAAFLAARPVLITGGRGFVGAACTRVAVAHGARVSIAARTAPTDDPDLPAEAAFTGELTDRDFVAAMLRGSAPQTVVQCAGRIRSADGAASLVRDNVLATITLLEEARRETPDATTVLVGSSAVYGPGRGDGEPIDELTPLTPVDEYGASKAAADLLAGALWRRHGQRIVRVRAFNMIGPGQSPDLVSSAFARQIALAEQGLAEPVLRAGRLDCWRDFIDVRDAARACMLLAQRGRPGEAYNVCRGEATRIGDMLDVLMGMARVRMRVESDSARRGGDVGRQSGSYAKLHAETGWAPRISLERSLEDLLTWWRHRLAAVPR